MATALIVIHTHDQTKVYHIVDQILVKWNKYLITMAHAGTAQCSREPKGTVSGAQQTSVTSGRSSLKMVLADTVNFVNNQIQQGTLA